MSNTFKTRPWWVQKFDPRMPASIHHDHRFGECVEETIELAEAQNRRGIKIWRHRNPDRCPRWVWEVTVCDPFDSTTAHWECYNRAWAWKRTWGAVSRPKCPGVRRAVQTYPNAACVVCDADDAQHTTCDRRIDRSYGWEMRHVFGTSEGRAGKRLLEKSRRARAHIALRNAARDWNANGDTDIEPELNMPVPPWWW